MADAAPIFCAGGTVFSALSKVRLDDSVHLGVWGAGGLGHYGIQLGKLPVLLHLQQLQLGLFSGLCVREELVDQLGTNR